MSQPWHSVAVRALTIALCLLATPALADVSGPARVIDGDSLEIAGERIRLHGIDAPENRQLCHLDGKPWQCGKDAANALAGKINRRSVACEELDRDRYRRIVAKCTVAGEDIGEWMVANGWAVAYYLLRPMRKATGLHSNCRDNQPKIWCLLKVRCGSKGDIRGHCQLRPLLGVKRT